MAHDHVLSCSVMWVRPFSESTFSLMRSEGFFFPTSLCGVLVFSSASARLRLLRCLLRHTSVKTSSHSTSSHLTPHMCVTRARLFLCYGMSCHLYICSFVMRRPFIPAILCIVLFCDLLLFR